jgi:2-polyprenyl-3-methyl-5-hydroxy-6-metoxy-1,4-benzoquinol methylase
MKSSKSICKICNTDSVANIGKINGYRLGTEFDILECKNCKTSYTNPCFSDEKIYDSIYKNITKVPGYSRYFYLAKNILNQRNPIKFIMNVDDCYYGIAKFIIDRVKNKSKSLIYEVGCGQGYLTYALVMAGYKSIGIDISSEAIKLARSRYGDHYISGDLTSFIKNGGERPNHIISSEVIEHISNPILFISEMMDLLKLDGSLILTTPNKLISDNQPWGTELPPVHLWWFTKNSLIQIAKNLSCEIEFIDLSDFYKNNNKYRINENKFKQIRTSILKEDYSISQNIENTTWVNFIMRIVKKILPRATIIKIQDKKMIHNGYYRCDNETSLSICAIFTKRVKNAV